MNTFSFISRNTGFNGNAWFCILRSKEAPVATLDSNPYSTFGIVFILDALTDSIVLLALA